MKAITNSILLVLLVTACAKPGAGTVNEKVVETKPDKNLRLESSSLLTAQESVKIGEYYFDGSQNKFAIASQLSFDNKNGSLILSDKFWDNDWQSDLNHHKVVYLGTEHYASVRNKSLVDLNVEDMRGFDFAPLVVQMKNILPWEGGPFVQHYVHIPTHVGQNRNHWKEGDSEYFFMPDDFEYSSNSHLPQFYKQFPDYELPANKTGITNFIITNDSTNSVAKKGYTFTNSFVGQASQKVKYDYDKWLYESGAPYAYTVSQEKINEWLASVDEAVLFKNFERYVLSQYGDAAHLVLNWEAVQSPYGDNLYKLSNCLKAWKEKYPDKSISLWPRGLMGLNRVKVEGNNFKYELTDDLKFNGNLGEWYQSRNDESPFGITSMLVNNTDINYVGGYLNYPTNFGYIHHFLMQHIMNKKFQPNKKSILMWWHNQEYVGGFDLSKKWFHNAKGENLYKNIKPMVFPSAMHNAAVWAFAFCDGGELWSEPYSRNDDAQFLGANTEVFNTSGQKIKTAFYPFQTGQYAVQNYKNIDRWEGGKWAISMNKDIIEASSMWSFVPAAKENEPFTADDATLPSYSLYDKTPIAAAKFKADNSAVLLLVYDAWNDPLKQKTILVKVAGKTVPVKVFGRYTSVVRHTL